MNRRRPRSSTSLRKSEISAAIPVADNQGRKISLPQYLLNSYGNSFDFMIDITESLLGLAGRFRKSDKKYHAAINILKYGIPATVFVGDLLKRVRDYKLYKVQENTVHNEKESRICNLMNEKWTPNLLGQMSFFLGKEVFNWILQKPKTEKFKITGFYNYEDMSPSLMCGRSIRVLS